MTERFDALLVSFQGSRAVVRDASGCDFNCKMRQLERGLVAGDHVIVEMIGEEPIIVSKEQRTSEFYRTDMRGKKKMIAANLDCLAIVIASEPEPHLSLIDRYLAGAELCELSAEIVVNKTDLSNHPVLDEVRRIYPKLGYRVTEISASKADNLSSLANWAEGKKMAFLGQSGVGKSSLINALTDSNCAVVGALSEKRAKGRHTTTASHIYQMPFNGWIMDSPGIRDFENSSWPAEQVIRGFRELHEASLQCSFRNCQHLSDKGCAVRAGLERGEIESSRFDSYRGIVAQL